MWVSGILYNLGDFDVKGRKAERFHRRSVLLILVWAVQLSLTLSHSYPFIHYGNKRKRESADYIFIHQRCCLSLLYHTWISWTISLIFNKTRHMLSQWSQYFCPAQTACLFDFFVPCPFYITVGAFLVNFLINAFCIVLFNCIRTYSNIQNDFSFWVGGISIPEKKNKKD